MILSPVARIVLARAHRPRARRSSTSRSSSSRARRSTRRQLRLAAAGLHARVVATRRSTTRAPRRARDLGEDRALRDRDRARARHAGRLRPARVTGSSAATRSRSCIVLPIALPGIVTGIALNPAFQPGRDRRCRCSRWSSPTRRSASSSSTTTSSPGCAGCSPNLEEASADLGADGFQTFRYVTFPLMRSALLAGGLLAFALCFDEIVVTTFTAGRASRRCRSGSSTTSLRPNQVPIVNVVATSS